MLKFITSAVLAGSFALTGTQHASACGGGIFGCKTKCAPAPAAACAPAAEPAPPAAAPATPEAPPAPPATAQNTRSQYRSYSYDPAPVYRAPATRSFSRPNNWQDYQFRADRKLRGL